MTIISYCCSLRILWFLPHMVTFQIFSLVFNNMIMISLGICVCVCVLTVRASPTSRIWFTQSGEEPGHQHFLKLPTWFLCIAKIKSHRATRDLSKLNIKMKKPSAPTPVTLKLTASQDWAHLLAKNIWCPMHTTGGAPTVCKQLCLCSLESLQNRSKKGHFPQKPGDVGKMHT